MFIKDLFFILSFSAFAVNASDLDSDTEILSSEEYENDEIEEICDETIKYGYFTVSINFRTKMLYIKEGSRPMDSCSLGLTMRVVGGNFSYTTAGSDSGVLILYGKKYVIEKQK